MDKLLLVLSLFTLPGSILILSALSNLSSIDREESELAYKVAIFVRFTSIISTVFAIIGIIAYFNK